MAEYFCGNCNKKAAVHEMRYDSTGSHLLCSACRGEQKPEKVEPFAKTPFEGGKTLKYQCPKCKYAFRRSHTPVKCPNCAGKKLIRYEKVTADDVLKMTDDERFSGL